MKTRKVEMTAARNNLAETKFQRSIFKRDMQCPLLFRIGIKILNHKLRKSTAEYKLTKSRQKINLLMSVDDMKLYAKKWKRIWNSNSRTESIKSGHSDGIWYRKTQQKSKCTLCGDRDGTINHIIIDCSKLAQKLYKTRRDWVGKVIHWEMYKKFKIDHTNKWYMHNLENDTHNLGQKTRPYCNQQKR